MKQAPTVGIAKRSRLRICLAHACTKWTGEPSKHFTPETTLKTTVSKSPKHAPLGSQTRTDRCRACSDSFHSMHRSADVRHNQVSLPGSASALSAEQQSRKTVFVYRDTASRSRSLRKNYKVRGNPIWMNDILRLFRKLQRIFRLFHFDERYQKMDQRDMYLGKKQTNSFIRFLCHE